MNKIKKLLKIIYNIYSMNILYEYTRVIKFK